jgi:histidinol-phosphatase (PHP family)
VRAVRKRFRKSLLRWTRSSRELGPEDYGRLADYHLHTRLCGHAVGEPEDYVRQAIALGLSEIGFSDHMPLLHIRDERLTMAPEDLPKYVDMVRDVQASTDEIKVRLGIEMDYFPDRMDAIWAAAEPYEFDYVLESVHYIDDWGFSDSRNVSTYRGRDADEIYPRYYDLFCEAAAEGGFDVMAHPDLIKKHGARTSLPLEGMHEAAAEAMASADVAVEVNTSGLRKTAAAIYPSLPFLRACAARGVPVSLGSDAHTPTQVGMDFDLALRLLKRAGVTEIATFESRRRKLRAI